jgi:phage terminase large subunit
MFVDSAFGSPIVARLQALGYDNVYEVNFGGASPDSHQENMRAYMWAKAKEWLLLGTLPDEDLLGDQLGLPGYHLNRRSRLVIESKEALARRGEASPDDADAFVLTFAQAVAPPRPGTETRPAVRAAGSVWG